MNNPRVNIVCRVLWAANRDKCDYYWAVMCYTLMCVLSSAFAPSVTVGRPQQGVSSSPFAPSVMGGGPQQMRSLMCKRRTRKSSLSLKICIVVISPGFGSVRLLLTPRILFAFIMKTSVPTADETQMSLAFESFRNNETRMGSLPKGELDEDKVASTVKNGVWQLYKFVSNDLLTANGAIAHILAEGTNFTDMKRYNPTGWEKHWDCMKKIVKEKISEKRGNCSQNLRRTCKGKSAQSPLSMNMCACAPSYQTRWLSLSVFIRKRTFPKWEHLKQIWCSGNRDVEKAFKFVCRELLPQVIGCSNFKQLIDCDEKLIENVDETSFGFIYHELARDHASYHEDVQEEEDRAKEKEEKKAAAAAAKRAKEEAKKAKELAIANGTQQEEEEDEQQDEQQEEESMSEISTSSSSSWRKGKNKRSKGGDAERQKCYLQWTNEAGHVMDLFEEEVNEAFAEVRTKILEERNQLVGADEAAGKRKKAESALLQYERERSTKKQKKGRLLSKVVTEAMVKSVPV